MKLPMCPCPKPLINTIAATTVALALAGCGGGGGSAPFAFSPAPAPAPVQAPKNTIPVANAGAAQNGTTGTKVQLDGSTSTDADADKLTFAWTLVTKPADSTAALDAANVAKPSFTPDVAGTYIASLVVNDGKSDSEPVTVQITVADEVAFDSMPAPFPSNMPSYGFEAYSLTSLGDHIALKPSSGRSLKGVTVAMSSWACESGAWGDSADCVTTPGAAFDHPVTITIRDEHGVVLATREQTFSIPYRPSSDTTTCTGGRWKDAAGQCFNGYAFKIAFDLRSLNVTLPDSFSYEVSYNTSHNGPAPLGVPGGYDSLNVGIYDATVATPTVGSDPEPTSVLWNGALNDVGGGLMAQVLVGAP